MADVTIRSMHAFGVGKLPAIRAERISDPQVQQLFMELLQVLSEGFGTWVEVEVDGVGANDPIVIPHRTGRQPRYVVRDVTTNAVIYATKEDERSWNRQNIVLRSTTANPGHMRILILFAA